MSSSAGQSQLRTMLGWIALVVCVLGTLWIVAQHGEIRVNHARLFWSAGRTILEGKNPYTMEDNVPFFYPPWTLTFLMPLGLLPFHVAHMVWLLFLFAVAFGSGWWAWSYFGGDPGRRWVGWLVCLTFFPVPLVIGQEQIAPMILLGIVGFLHFERKGQGYLAGAASALIAVKPQLFLLFEVAILIWAVSRRRWSVILGGGIVLGAATALAVAFNPRIFAEFRAGTADDPMLYATNTIGGALRYLFGPEIQWLQFLAPALGLVWLGVYWIRHGKTWRWEEQASILLLMSFFTTTYAWVYDMACLLPAMVQGAVWLTRLRWNGNVALGAGGYLVANAVAYGMSVYDCGYFYFTWMPLTLLLCYLLLWREARGYDLMDKASESSYAGIPGAGGRTEPV
jgi:hypothetical protein